MGWMPIDTAPSDGMTVLLTDGRYVVTGHEAIIGAGVYSLMVPGVGMLFHPPLEKRPTHWMPLPPTPNPMTPNR